MGATVDDIEHLYRTRYGAFKNGLVAVTGTAERAHDAVQEAFARALQDRARFRGDGTLEAWVWRIAFRVAQAQRRRLAEAPLDAAELIAVPEEDRDPELARLIRQLPPRRRLVLFLRYFADLDYATIAATCEMREGTVAATLASAHEQLRTGLAEREGARP